MLLLFIFSFAFGICWLFYGVEDAQGLNSKKIIPKEVTYKVNVRSKVTVRSSSLGVKFKLGMRFGLGVWLLGLLVEISPTEIF